MNRKKSISLLFVSIVFGIILCQAVFADGPGYVMSWENYDEEFNATPNGGDLTLGFIRNYSGKTIDKINIMFTIIGEDGMPIGKASLIMQKLNLKNNGCIDFKLVYKEIEENFDIKVGYLDFIYLSEITYKGGKTWKDPGNLYFLNTMTPEYEKQYKILQEQIDELLGI